LIPKLFAQGFNGKIYTTSATRDLVKILLEDSAEIQDRNVEDENRRRARQHLPLRKPLFTLEQAQKCMPLFTTLEYTTLVKINDTISVRYQDAGHILGSALIEVFVTEGKKQTKIVFSGDIGQRDVPITQNPTLIADADYVLMESTYGDRLHEDV
jgi:metallo-beta-lactamase family protein